MPQGWVEATLGDATHPIIQIKPKDEPQRQFDYVDIGCIDNSKFEIVDKKTFMGIGAPSRARRVIATDDVLFSTVRTYLKNIAKVPPEYDGALTSTGITVLRANEVSEAGYLFAYVTSATFVESISKSQDGTMYPAVTDKDVLGHTIPLPPLAEQKRIVAKLDALGEQSDAARAALDRIPVLVAELKRRSLALELHGLIFGLDTEEGLSIADIASTIFDGPFGSNLKTADYSETGDRVIRLENIGHLEFFPEKRTYISPKKFELLRRHELATNDILFSSFIADEIRVCRLPDLAGERAINKADCFCIRVDKSKALPRFIELVLASPQAYYHFEHAVHGATRPRINSKQMRSLRFNLPPLEEQREIVTRIETAFAEIDRLAVAAAAAREKLDRLDRAVLAKAFRGELVPQDPNDEPASALLQRINAEREATKKPKAKTKRKTARKRKTP